MKKYRRLLVITILSLLTIFGLIRLGNIELSPATLARVHGGWLLLVFVSFYLSILARGWRWRRILKTMGWPVDFVYAATLLTAGLFISAILPARAGDIGRVAMLKQDYKIPMAQGIASIAAERALDVFSILCLALLGAWWALPEQVPAEVLQLMVGGTLLFGIGLLSLLIVPTIEPWLREPPYLKRGLPPKIWSIYQKMIDFGFSLMHGVRLLGKKPMALTIIMAASFLIWLGDVLLVYLALITIGLATPLRISLFTAMVSDLAIAIPITPGAIGQFEAVLIGLLSLFDVSRTDSSLATLILRLVSLWTFIPVSGLVTYIFGFSRALKLNKVAETPPVSTLASTPTSAES